MAFADAGDFELAPLQDDPQQPVLRRHSAQLEDLYWSRNYWKEPYFRADYEYEDYAPAYCVGYTGFGQYGGCLEDAEKSLCANFIRIRGDSRLTWEEAREAVVAAWRRAEAADVPQPDWQIAAVSARIPAGACAV